MEEKKRYDAAEAEERWQKYWEKEGTYAFDPDSDKPIYSVDTPPPTVSGEMHLGHAFSYTQTDIIVRFKRMKGFNVFYPFGTDDNGLATERLIEKTKKVKASKMDRQEFIDLCLETLETIRPEFVQDWKSLGISCDWNVFYSTINDHSRKISQQSFLDLVKKDRVYRKEAPVIWDTQMQTALSQVELEDQEQDSYFNDITFKDGGKDIIIATTRPELLCSCVAVFVHPDDEKHKKLVGKELEVPVYHHKVKVIADKRVDPEKGTGIVMCCTFGDQTDIEWYKAYDLPLRVGITKDGKMTDLAEKYAGMPIKEARKAIIEDMKKSGELVNQKKIKHIVNVGERSGVEIEILESPQWFVRYLDLRDTFLKSGKKLKWYPDHMRSRYDNWVNGLQWDWCISRQRYFGVPFPVWYSKKTGEPIFADSDQLPVDPLKDKPKKLPKDHTEDDIIPETDVFDTWATSSLTPDLATQLFKDHKVFKKLQPMSLRPQAHDIISFWLFNTLVKSQMHHKRNPWETVAISGWALDAKGKKMSKSKGNVIHPQEMRDKYSADALRFWASSSKLGDDLAFSEREFIAASRTITKLWNLARFTGMHLEDYDGGEGELQPIDRWLLSRLNRTVATVTDALENYDYVRIRLDVDKFFMQSLADNYLEIVKDRLYGEKNESRTAAQYVVKTALTTVLKLFAPVLPHITEELYQEYCEKSSIHTSSWPEATKKLISDDIEKHGDLAVKVISAVRKAKSQQGLSLKHEFNKITIESSSEKELEAFLPAISAATKTKDIAFGKAKEEIEEGLKISID